VTAASAASGTARTSPQRQGRARRPAATKRRNSSDSVQIGNSICSNRPAAIDQRFIEYVLALTGRIIDLLRRAAVDALGHKSKSVGIDRLLMAGAHLPAIINQRGEFPI
jgi:hypothetical protein